MKRKKMISWIALITMAIIPVCAQVNESESDFKTHPIDDGKGLEITGYVGGSNEIHIPSQLHDLPVTSIGRGAFREHIFITHVIIPNSVTTIGVGAFWGCNNLLDVTIPDSVTTIGDEVFSGCSKLASITIPGSITRIGKNAFSDCTNLIRVIFQGTIASSGFNNDSKFPSFLGDLRSKFYATDRSNGTPGTYIRTSRTTTRWTKQS
ncbi:MAG: leucine-rich repeat domain-containing protein [Treponema sp.]|nr:leucine-rich repeat domain-containing protein [Treponema sp.]